jgi:ABC-2 type transport system permease protein
MSDLAASPPPPARGHDLRDTWIIARRELLERVQSKWFAIVTLLGPILMVGMVVLPALIAGRGTEGARVAIVDRTPGQLVGQPIAAALREVGWRAEVASPTTTEAAQEERIRAQAINGYLTIGADVLARELRDPWAADAVLRYRGDNAGNPRVAFLLDSVVTRLLHERLAELAGLSPEQRAYVTRSVKVISEHSTGDGAASSAGGAFLVAYFLSVILYFVIVLYGVAVMRSVVLEKSSRVMELMVAAVRPRALMAGKILGVGGAGLLQVAVWLAMGAALLRYRGEVLALFGIQAGGVALPALAAAELAVVVAYFLGGYFLYAALYAALGAMVSSEQETQQVQIPVTMLLVIALLCLQLVSSAPRAPAAVAVTLVPFWSPVLMPVRYLLGGASLGEVALSLGVLGLSIAGCVLAAAKIYRVGVLMYGKRPSLRELWRWLRY